MVAAASVIRHPERPRLCAQLLDAGDGADTIIAETGAKSALPKIIKAGYSALNVRGAVRAAAHTHSRTHVSDVSHPAGRSPARFMSRY